MNEEKTVFYTKIVNDEFYSRNGEDVIILERIDNIFCLVKFNDGQERVSFSTELYSEKEWNKKKEKLMNYMKDN